ncbi:sulfur carrier protein ThiS [Craterilacuibacter sinensis]|uniref:Sulfur carrier protein ThiS n=1 Tax=Craterilacuibacter sinensis TaxID=2686017 RepID=A0A845BKT0_9NEIS|nr:sulfur carrier protein ThiS [Craterilacuibacter sinensis]MXR36892.1 sulfur carrier protein ThiS [Craterilacuibacter sinensis]
MMKPDQITVHLNGEALEVASSSSLAALLESRDIAADSMASARNGEFVARSARSACQLAEGDEITLFMPIVGG